MVKSKVVTEHLEDLGDIFDVLRKHNLRLNASKCSFGVGSGKFLGFMVTHRGIEVNPDQIKAISNLKPPRNAKEVQKLTGMIGAPNQFISRLANRCRPFYLLINKWKGFEWSEECTVAFQQLKEYLSPPPIMSSPAADEVLYAYIAVAPHAVSLVLDKRRQRPPKAGLLRKQIATCGQDQILSPREGNTSCSPCFKEASPLLPSPHSGGPNSTTLKICASDRRLHRKDRLMEHDPRSFRHQVYAANLHKRPSPGKPSGRIRRTTNRDINRTTRQGRKTSRHGLRAEAPVLESVRRWRGEPDGIQNGASLNHP